MNSAIWPLAMATSGRGGTTAETELDGAERDDEGAEQGGDGAIAERVGGGAVAVHGVPARGGHLVPAPRVQERLLQVQC